MKLRNKKTGEIVCARFCGITYTDDDDHLLKMWLRVDGNEYEYNSLAELNAEWEDCEEPEMFYWIDYDGKICKAEIGTMDRTKIKLIGNYFETKEEAEKAGERLRAWKRLKDTYYIRFALDFVKNTISFTYRIDGTLHSAVDEERIVFEDMKTIFGGENE